MAAKDGSTSTSSAGDVKRCFVITPIGPDKSDIRRRADQVLKYLIQAVVEPMGYEVIRADKIADAGRIDTQVLDHVVQCELVIADLTGANPNVYYELAVRHALAKPFVQICQDGENLPFDIQGLRTIFFDHTDLDSVDSAKESLAAAVKAVEKVEEVVTPLSISVNLATLRSSGNPERQMEAVMLDFMADIDRKLARLGTTGSGRPSASASRARTIAERLEAVDLVVQQVFRVGSNSWEARMLEPLPDSLPTPMANALREITTEMNIDLMLRAPNRKLTVRSDGWSDEPPF